MINKEALEYLVDLGRDEKPLLDVCDRKYSTVKLNPILEPVPASLQSSFLDSLVTYITSKVDFGYLEGCKLIIEILSPSEISLSTNLMGDFAQRANLMICKAILPQGRLYNEFLGIESFIIKAQSCFAQNDDLAEIMKIVGNVSVEEAVNVKDDGISQQVTARTGIARQEKTMLPRRVKLAPYRTFPEIEQPESEFILRATKDGKEIGFALFEADGGAWRIEAMKRIKQYLETALKEMSGVVVLG